MSKSFYNKSISKIVILYGGVSSEREISLQTGEKIYQSLKKTNAQVLLLDTKNNFIDNLNKFKPEIVFIALHGKGGEDGSIQGLLETLNIKYTGSGVFSSAICIDKYRSKLVWKALGIPTPEFELLDINTCDNNIMTTKIKLPVFIKPNKEGSSVGVIKVVHEDEWDKSLKLVSQHSHEVLVESAIIGEEYTVGILGQQVLPVIRIESQNNFYDFNAKYIRNDTCYHLTSGLNIQEEEEIKKIALQAFKALNCEGWGRVDLMKDQKGKFWLLEINTIPGMTKTSLLPKAAKNAGLDFDQLVYAIMDNAMY